MSRLEFLRGAEMKHLCSYFRFCGAFTGLFVCFPRFLVLAGLWGYATIYGNQDVTTIFMSLQVLACLRASCELFATTLARVTGIQPSVRRVEAFLRLPEALVLPCQPPPPWVKYWPSTTDGSDKLPQAPLRLFGSFKWSEHGATALTDINITVQQGQMVAVLGSVGSGKSAFLQALLGELVPSADATAELCRPTTMAYCPQVPHIAEGTFRDNVLFGQGYLEQRYNQAVEAASMRDDLSRLPGGDHVPIGVRGIALSGGQRMRVSLARAAYHQDAKLVLLDDPFGCLDAPTGNHVFEKLLTGPLMHGRTRVVIMQPDADRLLAFDHVVILSNGCVEVQGTPQEVMATEAYSKLLCARAQPPSQLDAPADGNAAGDLQISSPEVKSAKGFQSSQTFNLRHEEQEVRPNVNMVYRYLDVGRWRNPLCGMLLFLVVTYLFLLCDLVLATWANHLARNPGLDAKPYLVGYLFWVIAAIIAFYLSWGFGERFTIRISSYIHSVVIDKLLQAPVTSFFDKQPVGRILNRMAADLSVVDRYLYTKSVSLVVIVYSTIVPIVYVHTIMPLMVTLLALPLYYVFLMLYVRYRNTTIPLRYCLASTQSHLNGILSDVLHSNSVNRAYGAQDRVAMDMCVAVNNTIKACVTSDRIMRRWLVNRVIYMWSFITTSTYLVGLMHPGFVGAGTLGVCITNLLLLETLIEPNVEGAIGSLFELISLARINEYATLKQEAPRRKPGDSLYSNFFVRLKRREVGVLTCLRDGFGLRIEKDGCPLLQASSDGKALVAVKDAMLRDLCPFSSELADAHSWHRITAVNDVAGDAETMALELCGQQDTGVRVASALEQELFLEVRSGWLAEGAKVELFGLRAAYEPPRDVLKGINLVFEPNTKVGIVGTTGCGKSSLLLVLLRILEPTGGSVLINGVDTKNLGLKTLRSALGLVPQEPVLFSGTLRYNLDPFGHYPDGRVWRALRLAQLEDFVRSLPSKLEHQVDDDGSNLSFGQRQLLCIARMVLRQPALLLLDEATSAIDPRTQESVQTTLRTSFPGSTIVAVAHRLETIIDFDHCVVMEAGDVTEQGTVKELCLRKDGHLRKMLSAKQIW